MAQGDVYLRPGESRILPTRIPYGQGPRDLETAQLLALLRALRAQADTEEATARRTATQARLADPLEAAKAAATVRQFGQRRDVRETTQVGAFQIGRASCRERV